MDGNLLIIFVFIFLTCHSQYPTLLATLCHSLPLIYLSRNIILSIEFKPLSQSSISGAIGDINNFSDPKKLTAFAGIDPFSYQSGSSVSGSEKVSKRGSPYLRHALFYAAFIAVNTILIYMISINVKGMKVNTILLLWLAFNAY